MYMGLLQITVCLIIHIHICVNKLTPSQVSSNSPVLELLFNKIDSSYFKPVSSTTHIFSLAVCVTAISCTAGFVLGYDPLALCPELIDIPLRNV